MVTPTGEKVQQFYNTTPFPDYELERFTTKESLRISASDFANTLDRSIPADASIIDVGTGTGQLSAYLSLRRKKVWGIDFSDSSLNKAKALKKQLELQSWNIKKVDILDEKQISDIGQQFDYVLCLGVLHHTGDAYRAFKNILKLLKPGGFIAIGLYNTYGRLGLNRRQYLARTLYKNNDKKKDAYIALQIGHVKDKEKARGWWNDQYLHPHETTHTIGEVMSWYKKNDIDYWHTVPSGKVFDEKDIGITGVWNTSLCHKPWWLVRVCKQVEWIWKTNREGGYWITFGKHKGTVKK